jgi:hypothetical protein
MYLISTKPPSSHQMPCLLIRLFFWHMEFSLLQQQFDNKIVMWGKEFQKSATLYDQQQYVHTTNSPSKWPRRWKVSLSRHKSNPKPRSDCYDSNWVVHQISWTPTNLIIQHELNVNFDSPNFTSNGRFSKSTLLLI